MTASSTSRRWYYCVACGAAALVGPEGSDAYAVDHACRVGHRVRCILLKDGPVVRALELRKALDDIDYRNRLDVHHRSDAPSWWLITDYEGAESVRESAEE